MRYLLTLIVTMMFLIACGQSTDFTHDPSPSPSPSPAPIPSIVGTFGPSMCFYNIEASQANNTATWTITTLTFNDNNSGNNHVKLYSQAGCSDASLLMELNIPTLYSKLSDALDGEGSMYLIDQTTANAGIFLAEIQVKADSITVTLASWGMTITAKRQ